MNNDILEQDIKYMNKALEQAILSSKKLEVPIGAVIVHNDRIIAQSHNMVETLFDPTAHAEMLALTQATNTIGGKYLKDCTMYVTLEPCTMCMGALRWSQIGRVVFGAKEEKFGYSVYSKDIPHPKTIINGGVLEDECRKLLKDFFSKKRSK